MKHLKSQHFKTREFAFDSFPEVAVDHRNFKESMKNTLYPHLNIIEGRWYFIKERKKCLHRGTSTQISLLSRSVFVFLLV